MFKLFETGFDLTDVAFWEHGHAYQPKRIVDGVVNSVREVPKGVNISLAGRKVSGRNWFELMLQPRSVYDLIVEAADGRTVDVEPITLRYLQKMNPAAYERLLRMDADEQTHIVATTYSHPILPLLEKDSAFDAKVNVTWGLRFYQQTFQRKEGSPILFWLNECAYSEQAAEIVSEAVEAVFGSGARTVFLLDEFQGDNIDLGLVHSLPLGEGRALAVFRRHWLSDAFAFSSDLEWILASFRDDVAKRRPRMVGTAMDAETYGGAYDAQKPAFFSRLERELMREIKVDSDSFSVKFMMLNKIVGSADASAQVKVADYTSWSDYNESQLIDGNLLKLDGIVARRVGGLCRWTGHLREAGKPLKETYFLVFEWVHPVTKERFVRVTNSLWKVAFNTVRRESANIVREAVFTILERVTGKEEAQNIPLLYGDVALETEGEERFLEKHVGTASPEAKKAVKLVLEAYRSANQEAMMSCPTFWQNFDTEVTWTSLSMTASGLALAAQACLELGDTDTLRRIAEKYQTLLIDFCETFKNLALEYEMPLDLLYERLREIGKRNGYDVEHAVSEVKGNFYEEADEIADRAYSSVFGGIQGKRFMKSDGNRFLILWRIFDKLGRKEEAREAYREARLYEWSKCLSSAVSQCPIPMRVGILHAKHFPSYEEYLRLPTRDVETETEILIGEAHAYV